jgi:cytoskeleton protein RodZ
VIRMQEIAEYLKSERLKQGLTLKEMSEKLRVSVSMLQALEDGNYQRIGTALLIRSFIRSYCNLLGIDSQPLLDKYASEIVAYDEQDEGIQRYGKWSKGLGKKSRFGVIAIVLFCIAVLGMVYGGTSFWKSKMNSGSSRSLTTSGYPQEDLPSDLSDKAREGSSPELARGVPPAAGPKSKEGSAPRPSAMGAGSADILPEAAEKPVAAGQSAERHQFSVEANQKTWIQVTVDDKNTQNAMLESGDKREWQAEKTMKITVGNAGGVQMKWDDRPIDVPAKPGSVIRFSLPDQRYVKE